MDDDAAVFQKAKTTASFRALLFFAALAGTLTTHCSAAEAPDSPETDEITYIPGGYLTVYFDNDLFGGTDEEYTNGVRVSWISRAREIDDLSAIYRGLDKFSQMARIRRDTDWYYNYGYSLTQLMFTPEDIAEYDYLPDERPYAGWLGMGFSLHAKNDVELHSLELSLGILGPASLAEFSQDTIHDIRGIEKANGWDNQMPNEPTINLHYRRSRRFLESAEIGSGFGYDSFYRWGADLGTMLIDANVGFFFRFGYNMPVDFSDPKLSLTAYTHQMFVEDDEDRGRNDFSFIMTFSAEARAVAHNIFLDGNVFRDSPSVDKRYFVADFTAGFAVRYKRFQYGFAETYRTEEFEGQGGGQLFGSVTMSFEF